MLNRKILLLLLVLLSLCSFVFPVSGAVTGVNLTVDDKSLVFNQKVSYEVVAEHNNKPNTIVTNSASVSSHKPNVVSVDNVNNELVSKNNDSFALITANYQNNNDTVLVSVNDGYETYDFSDKLDISLVGLLLGLLVIFGGVTVVFKSTINIMAFGLSMFFVVTYLLGLVSFGLLLAVFSLNGLTICLSGIITLTDKV